MASVAGYLFFSAYTIATGPELFYFQGSDLSTLSTVYINGSFNGLSEPRFLTSSRGKLYFGAFNTSSKYVELYQMVVDACPDDDSKLVAGACGCGVPDTDTDLDGSFDCSDSCPSDPAKTAAGVCGCGTPDADTDLDGSFNCADACPTDATKTAAGVCGCGVADIDKDGNRQVDCIDDAFISAIPANPKVRYRRSKMELVFTVPSATGTRYVFTVNQLTAKNGRVTGRKRFETTTLVSKRKLARLLIRRKKLSGWISVSYQLKIGSRLSPSSNTVSLRIR
jgi:hypothetical protein